LSGSLARSSVNLRKLPSTLAFERGAASIPQAMELAQSIEELVNYVDAQRADRRPRSSGLSALESRLAAARADAARPVRRLAKFEQQGLRRTA